MNKNTYLIIFLSVIALMAFLFGAYTFTNKPEKIDFPEAKKVNADDHIKWSQDKKIILVEYSDLQCPACQTYHGLIKQLEKEKAAEQIMKKVTFVYRHFPLDSLHRHARVAAYAAEAAGKQGKFFQMHDMLFDDQTTWAANNNPQELFIKYAQDLKLNVDQFKKDMDSKEVKQKVENDIISGNNLEVNSTPTFFLNGQKVNDKVASFADFKELLLEVSK
jgi:protein-disulfide isomerase